MWGRHLLSRIIGKYHRTVASRCSRRITSIQTSIPIISFTFDDAPRTAFTIAGSILKAYGARATFYMSLGLLGARTEVGDIASAEDLLRAVEEGHELGCHTFDHWDTWQTTTDKFLRSVQRNKETLARVLPGREFRTFAYPISEPRPGVKAQLEKYFMCCRGGGQKPNIGEADLNLLKAYFLDRRNNADIDQVKRVIDHSNSCQGWLIFATHDVVENPSPYGCTPKFFKEVVEYAARSGALLLTVGKACEAVQASK